MDCDNFINPQYLRWDSILTKIFDIKDIIICEPDIHGDNRGYIIETYRTEKIEEFLNLLEQRQKEDQYPNNPDIIFINHSQVSQKRELRGL